VTALLEHLDAQIESTRRMLRILLAQTDAIRRQDVEGGLARLGDVQGELIQRERLERERDEILRRAATGLGLEPEQVELDDLLLLSPAHEAAAARERSALLKGLLSELAAVHGRNRVLIRQELAFLDHLMRAVSNTPQAGYSAAGRAVAGAGHQTLDARA
jgi:hypothetical protein